MLNYFAYLPVVNRNICFFDLSDRGHFHKYKLIVALIGTSLIISDYQLFSCFCEPTYLFSLLLLFVFCFGVTASSIQSLHLPVLHSDHMTPRVWWIQEIIQDTKEWTWVDWSKMPGKCFTYHTILSASISLLWRVIFSDLCIFLIELFAVEFYIILRDPKYHSLTDV